VCLQRRQLRLQERLFYKVAAKSGYSRRFYSTLGHRYLMSDMPKKILKLDSNCKVTANVIDAHFFDLQFNVHDTLSAFTR